jgi:branched-chain amino acid transport system ATP-binding protein
MSPSTSSGQALLEVRDLSVSYGGIRALRDVSLRVEEGEIVALLGSNGAGKTTTLRAASGLAPYSGSVFFDGNDLRKCSPDQVVRLGLGHAPEGRRIFTRMTVRENLALGAYTVRSNSEIERRLAFVVETFPRLEERLSQSAGTLSGGEQQMLAIGRALMSAPRLLMLDEPSLGLAPIVVQTIFGVIKSLNERGTTILLVEQNAQQALRIANRGYVLETGEMRFEDTGSALLENPAVAQAYLGAAPIG